MGDKTQSIDPADWDSRKSKSSGGPTERLEGVFLGFSATASNGQIGGRATERVTGSISTLPDDGFDTSIYFFSVKVGPYTLLHNFTASLPTGFSRQAASIKEFCVNLMHNQTLNVTFTPSAVDSYAFFNGIEIISMPTDLYYNSSFDHQGVPIIGQNAHFLIDNYTTLQNVYRLNVGGPLISSVNDTGMYRNCYNDIDYYVGGGGVPSNTSIKLDYALNPNEKYSGYADAILNGLEVFQLSNSDGNLARPNSLPNPPTAGIKRASPKADKSNLKRNLLFSIGKALVGAKTLSLPDELCPKFSLDEIKVATGDFHEALFIGVGGFRNVYKGFLDDGETIVAIKRLNPESKQCAREFMTEIEMLSQLRHIHSVSLIGYCIDDNEKILVYDYIINGTLRDHLYDTTNDPLTWKQRLMI
ncbi:putative Malectin/receptor protein kinase family protein [Hibiscus syriacus]|uniref:Malectin/receptor protein kinase family protein n=1 Tax=Hibiscus syriacus TaxID=106335 RepID=A0A6A2ZVH4_HIBSY|nr:putative Malectin/receptor protein kinase family protein [Hibiscus syriacus]